VQTASTLPMMLPALPAGVLADAFDRRWLMFGVQIYFIVSLPCSPESMVTSMAAVPSRLRSCVTIAGDSSIPSTPPDPSELRELFTLARRRAPNFSTAPSWAWGRHSPWT
jgi:MFS family permease